MQRVTRVVNRKRGPYQGAPSNCFAETGRDHCATDRRGGARRNGCESAENGSVSFRASEASRGICTCSPGRALQAAQRSSPSRTQKQRPWGRHSAGWGAGASRSSQCPPRPPRQSVSRKESSRDGFTPGGCRFLDSLRSLGMTGAGAKPTDAISCPPLAASRRGPHARRRAP